MGVNFFGRAYSEAKLIKYAYAFEQTVKARRAPQFLPGTPLDSRGRTLPRAAFSGDLDSLRRVPMARPFGF